MNYIELGKKLYNMNNPREVRRMAVFVARAIIYNSGLQKLDAFFRSKSVLSEFIDEYPFPLEQATRAFFYKDSTFKSRCKLIEEHFSFLAERVNNDAIFSINGLNGNNIIWTLDVSETETLKAEVNTHPGQRKEGLSAINLNLYNGDKGTRMYQLMYWIMKDEAGKDSLYIGAMQGPNVDDARDVIKRLTKVCHGYRTKNLILYIAQAYARTLGIEKIYAVTNEGYYANNHARIDRKLKTDFSAFWTEAGGTPTDDSRFYELPLVESRKTMEEVPTRKRAVYRRRFALLDEIDKVIEDNVRKILK